MLSTDETVRQLLRTFNEARSTGRNEGIRGDGQSTPRMSRMWHEGSYAALEAALVRMRSTPGTTDGWLTVTLYWHLAERYLRSSERTAEIRVRVGRKHGKSERITVRRVIRTYSAAYGRLSVPRQKLCRDLGVRWLVKDLDRHGVTPFLPSELYEQVA